MFSLNGRTALVTGASRGIGKAIAIGLAEAGANIILSARNEADLADTNAIITEMGRHCNSILMDVSDFNSIATAFSRLTGENILPDILINNAGVEEVRPSVDVDEKLWSKIVDTNLKGAFFVAQNFARPLIESIKSGAILNICSLTSEVGVPTATPYTASKSGMLGMTRALSAEWASSNIRVNGIGPGYFHTSLTDVFYRDEAWCKRMLEKIPMGCFGELPDLIGAAIFLTSDASRYITGQLLYIDGGYMASI